MASRAFFNPKALLLVTPLASSTCTLLYARDQNFFLGLLTKPPVSAQRGNDIIPSYITSFFGSGPWEVLAFLGVTASASVASIRAARPMLQGSGALGWYAAGALFAVGHLAFVPAVAFKLKAMMDDKCAEQGTDNVGMLKRWLGVNRARMFTVDLAAWVCCLVAVSRVVVI